jgi:hypothetical protein
LKIIKFGNQKIKGVSARENEAERL